MKKIPKKKLDEIIDLTRQYWESGNSELLQERIDKAMDLRADTSLDWYACVNLMDGILQPNGFLSHAENDEIYSVLRILGWEAVDEEQTSESL